MDISKIVPTESTTAEQRIYTVTASFNFTDKDLEDVEVKAFFDALQEPQEEYEEDETSTVM